MKSEIDFGFYQRAKVVLENQGISATELLRMHPYSTKRQLAATIGNGVTARGLTMLLYEEAREQTTVIDLAKELLFRKIVQEFPDGWVENGSVRPTIRLAAWHYDIKEFAPEFAEKAATILRVLATTNKPEVGWKPTSSEDERLKHLFELNWGNID